MPSGLLRLDTILRSWLISLQSFTVRSKEWRESRLEEPSWKNESLARRDQLLRAGGDRPEAFRLMSYEQVVLTTCALKMCVRD